MVLLIFAFLPVSAVGQACQPPAARVISVQGPVESRRGGQAAWLAVSLDDQFCAGDAVRVRRSGRAALALPDQTIVRLDQDTTITFPEPQDDKKTWLEVLEGVMHVISRDPRALRVITPFANAGIEGTEFLVTVGDDATTVLVLEGRVRVENAIGSATAGSGESIMAQRRSAPVLQQVVRPRDQVVWTLYYPPTAGGDLPAADAAAIESTDFYVGRAERRLAVGRVTDAEADLTSALRLTPESGEVLARQSVIALTRNDNAAARDLADRAVAAAPDSAAARLAQSYVRQAVANLPGAIESLEAAAAKEPNNALVRARLAELWLASGEITRSEQNAKAAVAADPKLSLAQTVVGFVHLTRVQLKAATGAFEEAIRLEPNAPLPRLGLGLAKIRGGDLKGGRAEIETAVILDPNNSLIRSYMGKAYYEEKRDKLAASQLQIAKDLDPNDPTAWFYDAIRKQSVNRPVEGLKDLQKSAALNDRRAVYRSRLLLDDDAAARNSSVSAIYDELGFEALAVIEGSEALAENYGNSSAHRLLANVYARLPRFDISRASESLQAQIRQPLSIPPTNLRESLDALAVVRDSGPARVAMNEYNSLFTRDDLRIQADLTAGSRDTWGDQFVASGLAGRFGFSVGQLHHETDGFTANGDAEKDVYEAFLHAEVSPGTALQVEARHTHSEFGYTFFDFDDVNEFPIEIKDDNNLIRFNGRHDTSTAGNWIWTLGSEDRTRDVFFAPEAILTTTSDARTNGIELQRLDRWSEISFISGVVYISKEEDFVDGASGEGIGGLDTHDLAAYLYGQWRAESRSVALTIGLSLDCFEQDFTLFENPIKRTQLNPKFGLIWNPRGGTTLRAAAFTSVRRPFIANQTIEPTEIAGFNQFFTGIEQTYGDDEGTISRRVAVAVDQKITESFFSGVEGTMRRLEVPSIVLDTDNNWREKTARVYAYKTFSGSDARILAGWDKTLSLAAEYEEFDRPKQFPGPESILQLETTRLPLALAVYSPTGLAMRVVLTYVQQDGHFSIDTLEPVFEQDDDAWTADVLLDYRLPRRRGLISVGVRNLSDATLNLVEADPLSPRVATRRLVSATISLVF